jgi:3-deoxy-D-manno-octulosonic-acid transferase
MNLIYQFAIWLYGIFAFVFSFGNNKAKLWYDGRKNWRENISKNINPKKESIWIHCASLGEFEQGKPIIEKLIDWNKSNDNQYDIVLTFFSPSGYEIQKNKQLTQHVFYLPLDTKKNAKDFVELINPKIAIFVKYELWKNYIDVLHHKKIPLYIVSAIFRENQFFFQWYGKSFLSTLKKVKCFFVQNNESFQLLKKHQIHQTEISGDTRFDRVLELCKNIVPLEKIKNFKQNNPLFVIGSSWNADEKIIFENINFFNSSGFKIVLAPHEVHETRVEELTSKLDALNISNCKWSTFSEKDFSKKVLIIDNIGILKNIYQYADICYVGGGFGKGIHNTLEAATFGKPVVFGPNYLKFKEAVELIEIKGAFSVKNAAELKEVLEYLNSSKILSEIENNNKAYINQKIGATDLIINKIIKNI